MRVLKAVVDLLDRERVAFCLIGGGALAAHGVSRSTLDLDLLCLDSRVLRHPFWTPLGGGPIEVEVRPGDEQDPLAGVVRLSAEASRPVDIVVGRDPWQAPIPLRAQRIEIGGLRLPVATAGDQVLLKLWAGGHQDISDVRQLLAGEDAATIRRAVESALPALPAECTDRWRSVIVP